MSLQSALNPAWHGKLSSSKKDAFAAIMLAILALAPAAANGSLFIWPDSNDSMMRLVQVRDLLAGQGWYDYTQYRMGPDGGFVMHWSRIVDLPIAVLMVAVSALTGSTAAGELTSGIIWPTLLLAVSVFAIIRAARVIGGDQALFPAALIGAMSLYSIGIFAPGALDHHNMQLTLCLLALWAVLGGTSLWHGFGAGAAMAITMAIGLETLPFVAAASAVVAVTFLLEGRKFSAQTIGYGLGFASIAVLSYLATIGSDRWTDIHCDAFSLPHLLIAAIGGAGLAAAAIPSLSQHGIARAATLGSVAVVLVFLVIAAFPQCLQDPYAGLDDRLKTYWLSAIGEAQPVTSIWSNDPVMFAKYYATPIAALAVLTASLFETSAWRARMSVMAMLLVAVLISFWQVRGGNFAVALAAIPLAGWVSEKRRAAAASPGNGTVLAMVLAWVISLNACWTLAAQVLQNAAGPAAAAQIADNGASSGTSSCYGADAHQALAEQGVSTVAAVSNLGPAILKYTRHRVLAGPYHRNIEGNLATLDILMGPPETSRQVLQRHNVALVAHCPADDESQVLARAAPGGLLAALMRGKPPGWLEPVSKGSGYTIYRVSQN